MEWPSRNVPQGGILHPAKVSYSPETKQFVKLLLDESKLSMMQRKKFEYFLRNGEPFPTPSSRSESSLGKIKEPLLIRPGSSKRRTREDIVKSGVYEREKFIPEPTVDRDEEKLKLQNKMAYGKIPPPPKTQCKPKNHSKDLNLEDTNRFDELAREIKEREDWLKEMEELGEANKYRAIIQQQIQDRIRQMNQLKVGNNIAKKSSRSTSG